MTFNAHNFCLVKWSFALLKIKIQVIKTHVDIHGYWNESDIVQIKNLRIFGFLVLLDLYLFGGITECIQA